MTKFKLIVAVALSASGLASPAIAQKVVDHINPHAQSIYCATREPGNPHSRICDYIAWSKWRERGGWDGSLDSACYHDPSFVPGECGLDPRSRRPFGAATY